MTFKTRAKVLCGTPSQLQRELPRERLGPFSYLSFSLGPECNNNCIFCANKNRGNRIAGGARLSKEEIRVLFSAFKQIGGNRIIVMGDGEPFVRRNFDSFKDVAEVSGRLAIGITVFTNGRALSQPNLATILSRNNDVSFVVNVNSLNAADYEAAVRVEGAFSQVMDNLKGWREFGEQAVQQASYGETVRLAINTVLSISNKNQVDEIRAVADSFGAAYICTAPMIVGEASINIQAIASSREELEEFKRISSEKSSTGGPTCKTLEGRCGYIAGYSEGKNMNSFEERALIRAATRPMKLDREPGGIAIDVYGNPRLCAYMLDGFPSMNIKHALRKGISETAEELKGVQQKMNELTNEVFSRFGFAYCFMRHERIKEIEEWLRGQARADER